MAVDYPRCPCGGRSENRKGPGIAKASETVHNIEGAWVKEQKVVVSDDNISRYRVDLKVTFVLD